MAYRRRGSLIACAALVSLLVAGAETGHAGRRTLSPDDRLISWEGKEFSFATAPDPALCTAETCDEFVFEVAVPDGFWKGRRGGVEVSIRWASEQDDFDISIYKGDELVATSTGGFSFAESALIREATSGTYRVVVAPIAASDTAYEGIAQLEELPARAKSNHKLLPDLVTLPPRDFKIIAPIFYGTGEPVPYGKDGSVSCYVDEMLEEGARKCLRFSNSIANIGAGMLELRMHLDDAAGERKIFQVIELANGKTIEREAGRYEYHPTHAHLHYEGFALYQLYEVDQNTGRRLRPASEGTKSGFCLIDTQLVWWGSIGNYPRRFSFPSCNIPQDGSGTYVMGISRGWADVYTWDLPDQYVDITGLADGVYELVSISDSSHTILELDEDDNSASVFLEIEGNEVRRVKRPGS